MLLLAFASSTDTNRGSSCVVDGFTHQSSLSRVSSSLHIGSTSRDRKRPRGVLVLRQASATLEQESSTNSRRQVVVRSPDKDNTPSSPPWLERYASISPEQAKQDLDWLQYTLREQGFDVADILEVTQQIEAIADDNTQLTTGMVDFLRLLLRLVVTDSAVDSNEQGFVSKQVLLASLLHYAECISARREGLQDWIRDFISEKDSTRMPTNPFGSLAFDQQQQHSVATNPDPAIIKTVNEQSVQVQVIESTTTTPTDNVRKRPASIVLAVDDEVLQIAKGAARIKRAEILAHAVAGLGSALTETDASRLRGLLLSVMDDWRSLAIRCVACLYRLEGILLYTEATEYMERTPEMVQTAREAIRVYATLAQRLGMHRLKSTIEERAFRILYRRQYEAVSSLYREKGQAMQSVSSYLLSRITETLHQDASLMEQLEDLQVSARVKEPFSFWKKLLKSKRNQLAGDNPKSLATPSSSTDSLAMTEVHDGVALRVVLRARKWSADESEETTRARERVLCYSVQHAIQSKWPALDAGRIKDYIQHPKPNGYQSLHYTSSISSRGFKFPFEVQVRSEEMHRLAEFGIAAHWDYKLGSKSAPGIMTASVATVSIEDGPCFGGFLPPAKTQSTPINISTSQAIEDLPVARYVDALVTAKQDLLKQQVYVFLAGDKEGKLITLPTNSSVRDAVSALDCESVRQMDKPKIWLNGKAAYLDDDIVNGDLLLVEDCSCFE